MMHHNGFTNRTNKVQSMSPIGLPAGISGPKGGQLGAQ